MTVATKNNLVKYLPMGISTATLILVATLAYNTGELNTEMKKDIENNKAHIKDNKAEVKQHIDDKTNHQPLGEQIVTFVPRIELEGRMDSMEKTLDRIEEKLDNKLK